MYADAPRLGRASHFGSECVLASQVRYRVYADATTLLGRAAMQFVSMQRAKPNVVIGFAQSYQARARASLVRDVVVRVALVADDMDDTVFTHCPQGFAAALEAGKRPVVQRDDAEKLATFGATYF